MTLWVGSVCKIERRGEDGRAGPIPDFLFGQEVSTPWSACTAAGQRRGGCSRTRCHTWGDKKQNEPFVVDSSVNSLLYILKTNQEMSLTKLSLREMPAPASKMEEWVSPMKSEETTCRTQSRYTVMWPVAISKGVLYELYRLHWEWGHNMFTEVLITMNHNSISVWVVYIWTIIFSHYRILYVKERWVLPGPQCIPARPSLAHVQPSWRLP